MISGPSSEALCPLGNRDPSAQAHVYRTFLMLSSSARPDGAQPFKNITFIRLYQSRQDLDSPPARIDGVVEPARRLLDEAMGDQPVLGDADHISLGLVWDMGGVQESDQ